MTRLLLTLAVLLAVETYVFQAVRTAAAPWSAGAQRLAVGGYWGITLATVLGILLVFALRMRGGALPAWGSYAFATVGALWLSKIVVVLFLLADDLIRLGKTALNAMMSGPAPFDASRSRFLALLGLGAAAIPFTALIWGMVKGATDFRVRKITLRYPNLPAAFDGFRILQISDLHVGSYNGNLEPLLRASALINQQGADLVVMTGDLVNNTAPEAAPHVEALSRIRSKYPLLSVLGNHDYGDYARWDTPAAKRQNLQDLKAHHRAAGWDLLLNEHRILEKDGERIAILGVENWGARLGFPRYGDLPAAHRGAEAVPFKVLLSHDPSHWEAEGQITERFPDIDLTLSGHTHGMQFGINLPGFKWSPVQYAYKQWAGLYEKGRQRLYVNTGLGYIGYPGRVGFLPEITVIELKRGASPLSPLS